MQLPNINGNLWFAPFHLDLVYQRKKMKLWKCKDDEIPNLNEYGTNTPCDTAARPAGASCRKGAKNRSQTRIKIFQVFVDVPQGAEHPSSEDVDMV